MRVAKNGDIIQVHYTGRLNSGMIFDSTKGRGPLQLKLGAGEVLPDFESTFIGMEVGETVTIDIPSERAYGPYINDLIIKISKESFPADIQPEVGTPIEIDLVDGQTMVATIVELGDDEITIDANHPLAGKDLIFDVELAAII